MASSELVRPCPLFTSGDEVRLVGLSANEASRKLNGLLGTIVCYHFKKDRYEVALKEPQKGMGNIAARKSNLEFLSESPKRASDASSATATAMHVLIPCHAESLRRMVTFIRCAKSVMAQTAAHFSVFVGISATAEKLRNECVQVLCQIAESRHDLKWYISDEGISVMPQFEHLRKLSELSSTVNPNAWLLFVDNDDMFHPLRVDTFRQIREQLAEDLKNEKILSFSVPSKLLLNEAVEPSEGTMEKLVAHPYDFEKWKSDPALRGKVQLASTANVDDLDAFEYFDFCVHSRVLRRFMELTPTEITRNKFCDLRFYAILHRITRLEPIDSYPWLMAHYKVSMKVKMDAFDGVAADWDRHSTDQISMACVDKPVGADRVLAIRFPHLVPQQVAMCRSHVESSVIQYYGWDNVALENFREAKVTELNNLHGKGFGDALWEQVCSRFKRILPIRDSPPRMLPLGDFSELDELEETTTSLMAELHMK